MKLQILIFALLCAFSQHLSAQSAEEIHAQAIVVDTHNDFLTKAVDDGMVLDRDLTGKTHSDLIRWKKGGLDVQVFSVFCDGDKKNPFRYANLQMDSLDAVLTRNPDKIAKVATVTDLQKVVNQKKIAALIGVEGGHMIENNLKNLDVFYKRGARYMTLTWNNSTAWASSAFDEKFTKNLPHKGLTDFGKQVVHKMNQLGMLVDVSHVGEQTFWDVLKTTTKPIIASHSSVYRLCPHQRNLKDDQIKAIAKNGGVVQINFNPGFVDSTFGKKNEAFLHQHQVEFDSLTKSGMNEWNRESFLYGKYNAESDAIRPPFSLVIQHIEYVIKLIGVDYVGLGSDFDGITLTPQQLVDVACYPMITKALVGRGYSQKDINKILGGNFLRVLKANEPK